MRKKITLFLLVASCIQMNVAAFAQEMKMAPKTKVEPVTETLHGVTITDPYRWLEEQNSPATRAWIQEQNDYTQALLGARPERQLIKQRLASLFKIETQSVPIAKSGRYFFFKRRADQNQPVLYLRNGLSGKDEVLLDPNGANADNTLSYSLQDISNDGKLLLYGIRQGGKDEVTVKLMEVDTRQELADGLPESRYFGVALKADKSGFYYSHFGKEGPRVYYHKMGTANSDDVKIFGDGYGPGYIIGVGLSDDGRYLIVNVVYGSAGDKVEVWVQNLAESGDLKPIVKDLTGNFSPAFAGDKMYMQTNWEAPNYRLLEVNLKNPARQNWQTIIPEAQSVMSGFSLVGGKVFVNYLENVSSHLKVFSATGKFLNEIKFPTIGSASGMNGDWDKSEAFYTFNSFAQPTTIYRYDVATGKQTVFAQIKVPVQSSLIEVKQVWYESKDKTKIPMFLVYKKGLKLDGSNPTWLTGYGGFNVSLTPGFSSQAAYWAELGGVYAIANLRGGGEFGETWHKAGMLANKQNVFDDFIAAAEWLIANKYTNSSKLAISGGSNGGLLVGAALTQRPELYKAVICAVPLLDMIRYQNFLVARFWVPEYGSAEDAEQFKYLLKYSPYQNVKKGVKYPAVLFTTGDSDTRVAPLHARKMTALMQAATASGLPVLLHYDTKAGHSGGLPVSKQIEDTADNLTFLAWQLGVSVK
ncbi:MAG: S9 family peptidase [Acidobacteria bacterium]|nr:S9 family peptidase [Acidobacteriota bacterium]